MRKITLILAGTALIAAGGIAYAAHGEAKTAPAGAPMTREQAQQHAAQAFDHMDANKDGKIDRSDREAGHEARMQQHFDRIDTDGNGQISRAEMAAAHAMHSEMRGPGGERRMGMGRGMGGHHGKRGGMHGMHGMAMAADANKDGAISKAEMEAAARARFDRLDADKDGKLSAAEHMAGREAMRQQMRMHRQSPPEAGSN